VISSTAYIKDGSLAERGGLAFGVRRLSFGRERAQRAQKKTEDDNFKLFPFFVFYVFSRGECKLEN
jgi:hypothetical protein